MAAVVITDSLAAEIPSLRSTLAAVHAENSDGRGMSGVRNAVRYLADYATENGCRWAIPRHA